LRFKVYIYTQKQQQKMTQTAKYNATKQIAKQVNTNNYDSLEIGATIETGYGDFVCTAKPNIYQPIDSRTWTFEQATDESGEPMTDGAIITLK